jgi:hypothetical protein
MFVIGQWKTDRNSIEFSSVFTRSSLDAHRSFVFPNMMVVTSADTKFGEKTPEVLENVLKMGTFPLFPTW